ncbi:unnamed protein product [Paramecium sonneborni]|uniref:Uncharacterized protein n=1 Tax=Paramecium sonneborni TaxID=65129 RepID=A0A8S1PFI7_9CILI|nr:unnamed protein product [Paramecium sonneborni]
MNKDQRNKRKIYFTLLIFITKLNPKQIMFDQKQKITLVNKDLLNNLEKNQFQFYCNSTPKLINSLKIQDYNRLKIKNKVNYYVDKEKKQENYQKVQNYKNSILFKEKTNWTNQYVKKMQCWSNRIKILLNSLDLSSYTKNKIMLTIKLAKLFNKLKNFDHQIFKIIQYWSLFDVQCDFFYFDICLRVFDYIFGIGFLDCNFDKAIGNVIGGIQNRVDYKQYKKKQEFITRFYFYGKLFCDPDKLIMSCLTLKININFYLKSDEKKQLKF